VDKLQMDADHQAKMVAEGGGNLHEMSLSLEKADISMRLAMKVRNKLVDAYNEIMKMSV
jgi:flagellar hook-basal body complex protein FliE